MDGQTIQPKRHTPLLKGTLKNLLFPPEKGEYLYFNRAGECPFVEGDTIVKAAWAADASMLAYARYGTKRMTDDELLGNLAAGGLELRAKVGENPQDWNAPGEQAFFAAGNGFAVLAFRGGEIDDPDDVRAAPDILPALEPDHRNGPRAVTHAPSLLHLFSEPCLVHRGFQAELDRVWDQVVQLIADYRSERREEEICITGHSLGATAALLTYSRMSDRNASLYTFGCPRLGNAVFRDRVGGNIGKGHFRCVNLNDIITHLPVESALYVHVPRACHRFDEAGALSPAEDPAFTADLTVLARIIAMLPADLGGHLQDLEDAPAPPGAVDHSPARYCMRLWDCV